MNEPTLRIEYGNGGDLDLLRPLWLCLHHHHQSIAPTLAPYAGDDASWQTRRRFYNDCLSRKGSFVLLAYSGQELIGYALVLVQSTSSMWSDTWVLGDRTAELETIVVAPEWRGRGVASLLMDRVEAELEKLGIKDVIIGALPSNSQVRSSPHFAHARQFCQHQVLKNLIDAPTVLIQLERGLARRERVHQLKYSQTRGSHIINKSSSFFHYVTVCE